MAERISAASSSDSKLSFPESDAKALAEDIQINVGRALKNPDDQRALEYLQRDAGILLSPPQDGDRVTGKPSRMDVQEHLDRLENNKILPKITITNEREVITRDWLPADAQVEDESGSKAPAKPRGLFARYSSSAVFDEKSEPGSGDAKMKAHVDRVTASNLSDLAEDALCNAGFPDMNGLEYGSCPQVDPDSRLREIAKNFARMSPSEMENLPKASSINRSYPLWKPIRDHEGKLIGFDYSQAPVGADVQVRFGQNNKVTAETITWGDIFRIGKMHRRVTNQ